MPINCPKSIRGICDSICGYFDSGGGTCNFNPHDPIKLKDLLTLEERIERLENNPPDKIETRWVVTKPTTINELRRNLVEYIDSKLKPKKKSKYD